MVDNVLFCAHMSTGNLIFAAQLENDSSFGFMHTWLPLN